MTKEELSKTSSFPLGNENIEYQKYFVGKSFLAPLNAKEAFISNVTFEPKCRNDWHVHNVSGQILVCVGGHGWYQEWEKPAQKLSAGDVVYIAPGVKHWHGASSDESFAHLAISVPKEEASTDWLEKVSDEDYERL